MDDICASTNDVRKVSMATAWSPELSRKEKVDGNSQDIPAFQFSITVCMGGGKAIKRMRL